MKGKMSKCFYSIRGSFNIIHTNFVLYYVKTLGMNLFEIISWTQKMTFCLFNMNVANAFLAQITLLSA